MLKVNVGSSILSCAKTAGKEAASKAKIGLDSIKMAFVYGSCDYNIDEMLSGVAEELPDIPLIGNTSFTGIITPEGFIGSEDGFVGVMALSDPDMIIGIASKERGASPVEDGKLIAAEAMKAANQNSSPNFFYMAASPAEEEFYLKGISSIIGRIPFFGGSAADNSISGNWKLYTDNSQFSDGVVIAFFYGDIKMTNLFTGSYRETDDFGVITKVDGNRTLVEIDGVPATKKYAKWRGIDMEAVTGGNLLATTITSPLGVKDRLGDLIAIRHPMNGNDDLSMAIGNNLSEKTCVIRMEATVDELISSTGETLKALIEKMDKPPIAFHLVHCGGRRAGIDSRIDEVAKLIKEAAGDIPFIVEFTFGEYGFESDNNNTCGGLMLSFTGFLE
ncbi:FIST signal transduction protein [Clostridium neonatale]|uniref:FIST signal transduction protein n=1 Tax=Clostridium neonatale TaxID=137838 RepID=UPI003D32E2D4